MAKMKAGFIGFTPFGGDPEDFYKAIESYASIGYKGFEGGDMLLRNGDPEENLKRVKSYGIEPLTVMIGNGNFDKLDVKTVIEKAHKLGVRRAASFMGCVGAYRFGQRDDKPTYDEIMKELEMLNNIAKELQKEDIVTTFHNHDAEFINFYQGKPAFYQMVDNSEYLKFELDAGWALYGHYDPLAVMDYCGDKLKALHIKDFTYSNVPQQTWPGQEVDPNKCQVSMPRFTTPGTGMLPLKAVLKKAEAMGIDIAIVEQDFMYNMTPYETLNGAYLNMKETGLVE